MGVGRWFPWADHLWCAGSELSVGTHYLIQSPRQAFGILVFEMKNLIWTHEKFKEV